MREQDQNDEEPMDNWKQFQGTELGHLLGGIYGNANKPKINYPKPKPRSGKSNLDDKNFIPGGAKLDASDPRKATRRAVNVAVPKLGQASDENRIKPIDIIPKRRGAESIQLELEEIRMRTEKYRPAYVQPYSSEQEKERLSQIFTYKGGKGLPKELTLPVGDAPFEIKERNIERDRIEAIRIKRGLSVPEKVSSKSTLSVNEMIAQQIKAEIDERTSHIEEMRKLGSLKPQQEKSLMLDLAAKVNELNRLG